MGDCPSLKLEDQNRALTSLISPFYWPLLYLVYNCSCDCISGEIYGVDKEMD